MQNIDHILRRITRDRVPQFEEKRREVNRQVLCAGLIEP
jgi:hypothetical protein